MSLPQGTSPPRTCVVLGSNCFTGAHLVAGLLSAHWRVVGVSRSPEKNPLYLPYDPNSADFTFVQLNLVKEGDRLLRLLDELQPEAIVNVAALSEVYQSHLTPKEYFAVNTSAVVRLGNELKDKAWLKRFVQISTAEVYGNCVTPVKEGAPANPSTPYAASKVAGDMYLTTAARFFGFPLTLIRSTNVYGRHQQLYKIIPRTLIYLRTGKKIALHGGGKVVRPFVHVRDVIDGVLKVIDHPRPEMLYHLSTPDVVPIHEIIRRICTSVGASFEDVTESIDQRPSQDARYWLDTTRAETELGWAPKVSWEQGIRELKDWINENWEAVRKEPLEYQHQVD